MYIHCKFIATETQGLTICTAESSFYGVLLANEVEQQQRLVVAAQQPVQVSFQVYVHLSSRQINAGIW